GEQRRPGTQPFGVHRAREDAARRAAREDHRRARGSVARDDADRLRASSAAVRPRRLNMGGPEMAPHPPPTLGAARETRAALQLRWGPRNGPHTPNARSGPGDPRPPPPSMG